MSYVKKQFQYGKSLVTLETGRVARQADGAVLSSMGDTVVLVTCVIKRVTDSEKNFLPLTIDYQERTYAAGKIPGGFFRREGRPSEKEILTSRLIDRPLRPLFPKWFRHEVQIIATVLSLDANINPDVPALLGAAAAVKLSGVPSATLSAARVGYIDGEFTLNPSLDELTTSKLDLLVAGTASSVLMVESEAKQLPEETMLGAVFYGHQQMQVALQEIEKFVGEAKSSTNTFEEPSATSSDLIDIVRSRYADSILEACKVKDKLKRGSEFSDLRKRVLSELGSEEMQFSDVPPMKISVAFDALMADLIRTQILDSGKRMDGRSADEIRPISIEVGVLPRTHGSALFTRGETQALVVTSLGTARDAQIIDAIEGERKDSFMLHYNFPPFCVGEVGRVGTPKRREIGHGRLAKRAVVPAMPDMATFPYTIRVVSEITESNGSSSMASVCGTSLSLMDAGVQITDAVSGIAMGLIKKDDRFVVLSDIMGDEDHLGDMDFKVAGTKNGITALQMDIKIDGVSRDIMQSALAKANVGRLHILEKMNAALDAPRHDMSEYAPRITIMTIKPDKIRDVIGKGGATIRSITEETGAVIDIEDNGTIKIAAVSKVSAEAARKKIEDLTADIEVGKIYEGRVQKLMEFGAFVNILPGKDGLVHISQISDERVERVGDKMKEGELVKVKVLEVDRLGRVRLSMKEVNRT